MSNSAKSEPVGGCFRPLNSAIIEQLSRYSHVYPVSAFHLIASRETQEDPVAPSPDLKEAMC